MYKKYSFAIAVAVLLPSFVAAAPVLRPGKWEVTLTTVTAAGNVSSVAAFCISQERAEKLDAPKGKDDDDCKVVTPAGLTGNVLAYTVKCSKKDTTADAKFTYHGDHYEGEVTIKSADYEVRQVHSARRLGDCDPAEDEGRVKP